jgi:Skp family chaperone for outer membrane proteins
MKKVLLAAVCLTALCFVSKNTNAQAAPAMKIGVFDFDIMIQALPEYRGVDSLTQIYERDSLGAEYQVYQGEYQRLDSTLKADSAKGNVSATIMQYNNQQKQQMMMNLVYWQQIAQQKSDNYRNQKLQPSFQKILVAYKKVLAAKKYALVLKPSAYEVGSQVENMFPLVAKEMNITLPPGLTGDPNQALNDGGVGALPSSAGGKP